MRTERLILGAVALALVACGKPETVPPPRRAPAPARRPASAPPSGETPPAPPAVPGRYDEQGDASFYGAEFAGRPTASGERFDPAKQTAAHRTFPFGTELMVTNLDNGRSVRVRVNDRGPFVKNRILDCSTACAEALGYTAAGTARVGLTVLKRGAGARTPPPPPSVQTPPATRPDEAAAGASPPVRRDEDDPALGPGVFAIQVGAFANKAAAEATAAQHRARGYRAYLRDAGGVIRVRLGPYPDERAARAALARLGEGLVVREDRP